MQSNEQSRAQPQQVAAICKARSGMDAVLSPPQNGIRHDAPGGTGADTRLHGRTLLLARGLYVLLVILLLGLFAAGMLAQRRFRASGNIGLQIDYNQAGEAVVSAVTGASAT